MSRKETLRSILTNCNRERGRRQHQARSNGVVIKVIQAVIKVLNIFRNTAGKQLSY